MGILSKLFSRSSGSGTRGTPQEPSEDADAPIGVAISVLGTQVVPRVPHTVTFRPPRIIVQHRGAAVIFGPTAEGNLGFSPVGAATVDDVSVSIDEVPSIPIVVVSNAHFRFSVDSDSKLYSTPSDAPWPFEIQLESAAATDEMLHIQGPLHAPVDSSCAVDGHEFCAAGQIEKENGSCAWTEWSYLHNVEPWRQRRFALVLRSVRNLSDEFHYVLTAQCPASRMDEMFAFADSIVRSLGSRK